MTAGKTHRAGTRLVGTLMIASELMLLVLTIMWLRSQYRETEKILHDDIQVVFDRTETQITDSLLSNAVAHILKDVPEVQPFKNTSTLVLKDSSLIIPANLVNTSVPKNIIITQTDADAGQLRLPDSVRSEDDLIKHAMRIAFLKLVGKTGGGNNGLIIMDTQLLKKNFSEALAHQYPHISTSWSQTADNHQERFRYHSGNNSLTAALQGYNFYILQRIWPEFAFALFLIILTIAAFVSAYRTIKRQTTFGIQKDSFISNVSHELKTPVAATQVALEALKTYGAIHDAARSEKYLNIAAWEMNRLRVLIDRVIDNLQAGDNQLILEKKSTDVSVLLRDVTQMLQPAIAERGAVITWDISGDVFLADVDNVHFTNALYNLLDNALKYGGTKINLTVRSKENEIILAVADDGIGIEKEHQQKIFEQFYRVPQGNIHNTKGHGLGLSYTSHVVQIHGGKIKLESEKGKGAMFIISIPKSV